MNLWNFATALYQQAGVAEACLALQERHEVDVCQLMFALWIGLDRCIELQPDDVTAAARFAQPWREGVVARLRAVRVKMKGEPLSSFHSEGSSLREHVKALELRAEMLQLQAMESWAEGRFASAPANAGIDAAIGNLQVFVQSQAARHSGIEPASLDAVRAGLRKLKV